MTSHWCPPPLIGRHAGDQPLHEADNATLQRILHDRLSSLAQLRSAIGTAVEACDGHATLDAAAKAADREALVIGEAIAVLEEQLAVRRSEEAAQLAVCEELAEEAKAVRSYIAVLKGSVGRLSEEAGRRGVAVNLDRISREEAADRLRQLTAKDAQSLKALRDEVEALDKELAAYEQGSNTASAPSSSSPSIAMQRDELRHLQQQEATIEGDIVALEEEVKVNTHVIVELERQISVAGSQMAFLDSSLHHRQQQHQGY